MADLHETLIDGVRCFWVESNRPTLAGMLMFRFGMADEPINEAGWQHLLEHLALEGRGGGAVNVNGHVSMLETVFQVHAPSVQVAELFGDLSRWLAAPELTRLDHEAKVLRAEATMRGANVAASALTMRYGARGPGLAGYREPGLGRATSKALAARAAKVFTRDNAVLVLDGPPPEDLGLPLPPGDLMPFRPAVPCEDVLPAAYLSETGLTVSGVVTRSSDMHFAHELLREAMSERFRTKDGSAYAPWVTYERVDRDHAVVIGGSDIHPDGVGPAADKTMLLVNGLRKNLAEPVAFEHLKAARIQALTDPYAVVGIAVRAAHEALQGCPPLTLDEMVEEIEKVDLLAVKEGWEEFHASMLLGVPPGATWVGQLPVLNFPSSSPSRGGKRYRSVNWPADRARLTITDAAVEISVKDDAKRVPLDQVAALFSFGDGFRNVVRQDGYSLSVDPKAWRAGTSAVARIDAVISPELQLPHPPLTGEHAVRRLSVVQRWGRPVLGGLRRPFRLLDRYLITAGLVVLVAIALVAVMASQDTGGYLGVVVAAVVSVRLLLRASGRHLRSCAGREV